MLSTSDQSSEAKTIRSHLSLDRLKTAIETLKSLEPVFEELRDRRIAPKFIKAHQNVVNTFFGVPQLDIVQTAKPLRDLHAKLAAFLRWCEGNYSGRQLCGDISPPINSAFEMFNVQVDYPRSAKALGTFRTRYRAQRPRTPSGKKTTHKRS